MLEKCVLFLKSLHHFLPTGPQVSIFYVLISLTVKWGSPEPFNRLFSGLEVVVTFKNGDFGTSLMVPVPKTLSFQCRGADFDPLLGK